MGVDKKKRINNCIHNGWIQADNNTWWKLIGSKICNKCNEPKIIFQKGNCFRCQNKINQNDYLFVIHGYYYENHIFCQHCAELLKSDTNITIKIINNQIQ